MRALFAALAALALAACSSEENLAGGPASDNPAGGYTLEVRADQDVKVYLVTDAEGNTVASRATGGVSSLMDVEEARAFNVLPATSEPPPEVMSLRVPGFEISIAAEGDSANSENARVQVNAGGRTVDVTAQGDGAENDRAHVRITGASEADVRDFIADAEELTPETRTEMLAALGLS